MNIFQFILILTLFITSCSENQSRGYNNSPFKKKQFNTALKHWKLLNDIKDSTLQFQQTNTIYDINNTSWVLTTNNSYFSNFSYNHTQSCGNGLTYIDTVSWVNKNDTIDLFLKYGKIGNIEIYELNNKYIKVDKKRHFELIQIQTKS